MKDLTVGSEGKLIFKFALPMLLGNVFQQLYQIINMLIVGNYLGDVAVAAVGASFPVLFLLISLVVGLSMGMTILISQYYGAKNYGLVKQSSDTMYIVLAISAIILTLIGLICSKYVFYWIKLPEVVRPYATRYLQIQFAGMIFFFLYNGAGSILRGLGDSKTPLYFLIVSTGLNTLLDFLFVLVFNWGVESIAVSTVISQGVACIWSILYINKHFSMIKVDFFRLHFDKNIFKESIRIGLPAGVQQALVAMGMIALLRIVNDFGTSAIAAYTIAGRIDSFALLPAMNFSMALSTFVGQNIGAKKFERVRNGYMATMKITTLISIVLTLMIVIFSRQLLSVFIHDTRIINIGINYLVVVSSFYVFFSVMFVNNGVMRGAGDTIIPMFITLFSLWIIRIPTSWILSKHLGVSGIWWGIPIAWFIGMVFSYIYYRIGNWKKQVYR